MKYKKLQGKNVKYRGLKIYRLLIVIAMLWCTSQHMKRKECEMLGDLGT